MNWAPVGAVSSARIENSFERIVLLLYVTGTSIRRTGFEWNRVLVGHSNGSTLINRIVPYGPVWDGIPNEMCHLNSTSHECGSI
jgi:hypothetical protein